ncbi:MAG TPA: hypothetical protein VHC46_07535 [Thermodesulfobacteriota bacterium]|nr:hypothetical protein [Candidatus Paceibacterota bacterium]HVY55592.1 hypothetical protein [Thermodesulfobacteriota bacterium]
MISLHSSAQDSFHNVGELLDRALKAKAAREYQSVNPRTDNFPALLDQSGVEDPDEYLKAWIRQDFEKSGGYSEYSRYRLFTAMPGTDEIVVPIRSPREYATVRELLGVYLANRAALRRFLRFHRIVAYGRDQLNQSGAFAAVLSLERGKLFLRKISTPLDDKLLLSDAIMVRYKGSA